MVKWDLRSANLELEPAVGRGKSKPGIVAISGPRRNNTVVTVVRQTAGDSLG